MKRIFLITVIIAAWWTAIAQPSGRYINFRPAYPMSIGSYYTTNHLFTHYGLDICDIIQDSLPVYEIGQIGPQTIRFTQRGQGFYVKADSLHADQVVYACEPESDSLPRGPIEFYPTTGRFKFFPSAEDFEVFYITFRASNGSDTISERVKFSLIPQNVPESYAFQSLGTLPDGMNYTLVAERSDSMMLNNVYRKVFSYSISGKDVLFDNNVQNKVWGLSGREDIYELNIYAERLIVRSALSFPQTNITIYAREIIFEDGTATASINTSPSPIHELTNGAGSHGGNAGNITLHVKRLMGDLANRFIMNGGKGQSTNRNGTPGNGDNGGIMTCNLNIGPYCDMVRGSAGVRYGADSTSATLLGDIVGSGQIGNPGHFVLETAPFTFLHPNYVAAALRYVDDAFINNQIDFVRRTCEEYRADIQAYLAYYDCDTCCDEGLLTLSNHLNEIEKILSQLDLGLDYFGNPIGWVPLLSFEVMLANFDNEVARAIPTLYMYYWLNRIDLTLQRLTAASQFAAETTEGELRDLQNALNYLVAEIPVLQDEADDVQRMINETQLKIDRLRDYLMSKARKNVKKINRIKKGVAICKSVANVLPVLGPWGAAASGAINGVLNSGVLDGLTQLGIDCSSPIDTCAAISEDSHMLESVSSQLSGILSSVGNFDVHGVMSAAKDLKETTKPLVDNLKALNSVVSHGSAPKDQVDAVFNMLCAQSAEWNQLKEEMDSLNDVKVSLVNHINQTTNDIIATLSDIGGSVMALDGLKQQAYETNSKRDLCAMQYIEEMEQKAKNRLLKYHYYMRKAYEYRLLKPFEGEFNLVGMFERLESFGLTFDSVVSPEVYSTLASIFKNVLSEIAEEVIDEYSNNFPEQSAPITIAIPREQLDIINNNGAYALNFYEMGIFSPDEENVRIVDLGIQHIETHVEGNVGYSGYMDLNMTHRGISRLRKNGQVYWFDHMSRTTTTPHTWGIRYDAISQESTNIQPSAASSSLLSSLINSSGNIMLFSRPSAWGDILLAKKVHTQGGGNIVIDSLVLRLQYDFVRRPSGIRNIDITTNEDLLPYIACSVTDINGRDNGNGNLNRSYSTSSQPVTFTAIEQYGSYYFTAWTDRAGDTVSTLPALTVSRTTDQFYQANYERRVPILSVPDTIKVPHCGGMMPVLVTNVGSGDEEMEWEVDDSVSSWVHLLGTAEGVDSGVFTFYFDFNESGERRIDSLEIFAPETDLMSKMIYIVQVDSSELLGIRQDEGMHTDNVRIFPNPATKSVMIEGDGLRFVRVFSAIGQEQLSKQVPGVSTITLNIGDLPNGVYVFAIETHTGTVYKKVIKR